MNFLPTSLRRPVFPRTGHRFTRKMLSVRLSLAVLALLALTLPANAVIIIPETDLELVASPVVVVGYWRKEKRVYDVRKKGGEADRYEVQAHLVVTKVLRGNLKPGIHQIIYSNLIDWQDDGKGLGSMGGGFENTGDLDDVTKSNIWFLAKAKSWDKHDPKTYLKPLQWRSVQSIRLLTYYTILMGADPDSQIAKCLTSDDPLVLKRSLQHVAGHKDPWPFGLGMGKVSFYQPPYTNRLVAHLPLVERIARGRVVKVRPYALALLAEERGRSTLGLLRACLKDQDLSVRGVAAGYLIRFGDHASDPGISRTFAALRQAFTADGYREESSNYSGSESSYQTEQELFELVAAMRASRDQRYVPDLISLLEPSTYGAPAVADAARVGLQKIVHFQFPFDSHRSLAAWNSVRSNEPRTQIQRLNTLLGAWIAPLTVTIRPVYSKDKGLSLDIDCDSDSTFDVEVTMRNRSKHSLVLRSECTGGTYGSDYGSGGILTSESPIKYVQLKPGGSVTFRTRFGDLLYDLHSPTKVELEYFRRGKGFAAQAWLGRVTGVLDLSSPVLE